MKSDYVTKLLTTRNEISLPLEQWLDELFWCPSQCYYHIQHHGEDYILYLRWRRADPWQAYIIKNAANWNEMRGKEACWSEDVFLSNHIVLYNEELDLAKVKLLELFKQNDGESVKRKRSTRRSTPKSNR